MKESTQSLEPGTILPGDYVIDRLLGQGGMGNVWLAENRSTGKRFAVKSMQEKYGADTYKRNVLLDELQAWIDLPEHPYVAACRFFRTFEGRTLIFADYVAGGALRNWIRDRKLSAMEAILDVAIQFAWGLHFAHRQGLVHQDVKPANVLMTENGIVKVTDFGLARARFIIRDNLLSMELARQNPLVSTGGMTPAYCSPEQAARKKLSFKTDIWSWGLSILEIFSGNITWLVGPVAGKALELFISGNEKGENRIANLPEEMADLLKRCFQIDPDQRPKDMLEVANQLREAYRAIIGEDYFRPEPGFKTSSRGAGVGVRRTPSGGSWRDPDYWLRKAHEAEGAEPAETVDKKRYEAQSRRGQLVAELLAYEEAYYIYSRLVDSGRNDLEEEMAEFCLEKSFIHDTANDPSGAFEFCDKAIEIMQRLITRDGRGDLSGRLANVLRNKAAMLGRTGSNRQALELYDRAIEVWENRPTEELEDDDRSDLAVIYFNKGSAMIRLGIFAPSIEALDKAIAIWERLVETENGVQPGEDLAKAYANKAISLKSLGKFAEADVLYGKTIAIFERLVHKEKREELAVFLPMAYLNRAMNMNRMGKFQSAVDSYDRAIELWEHIVNERGRSELAHYLGNSYMNKANAVSGLGDESLAISLCDQAIAIYGRLVNKEGCEELSGSLAMTYMNKADAHSILENFGEAAQLNKQAVFILDRATNSEGKNEHSSVLAAAMAAYAVSLLKAGEKNEAREIGRQAVTMLVEEIDRTDRVDLKDILASTRNDLREVLRSS